MNHFLILTTLFVVSITLPAAKKEEVIKSSPFYELIMQQYLSEEGLAEDILEYLNKNDWVLVKQFQANPDNPLVKALVLKDETIILFYKNGLIEIHKKNQNPTSLKLKPDFITCYVIEYSSKLVMLCSQNGQIFHLIKDATGKWHLEDSRNVAVFEDYHESLKIDDLPLNTSTPQYPTTGFTVDANGLVKVYAFVNQKKMLENIKK